MSTPYDPPKTRTVRQDWREQALCRETDPEAFFPEKGNAGGARQAEAICRDCPVRTQCLTEAITNKERYGVWGGMSERKRRALIDGKDKPGPQRGAFCRRGHATVSGAWNAGG